MKILATCLVDSIKTALEKKKKSDETFYCSNPLITLFWMKSYEEEFDIFVKR